MRVFRETSDLPRSWALLALLLQHGRLFLRRFILKIVHVKRVLLANLKYSLLTIGLTDGGTAGLIWGFVIVCIGFLLVFASLAEMASM